MKRSKLSETQIINMLNDTEAGQAVNDVCRKYGIGNSTYYKLKSKYAGLELSELKRLRELETENLRLKQMYADISLEHKILKDIVEKKLPLLNGEDL